VDTLGRSGVTALGKVQAGLANDFEPVVGSLGLSHNLGLGGFVAGHAWICRVAGQVNSSTFIPAMSKLGIPTTSITTASSDSGFKL
jgi:hypothetical protein